MWNFAKRLGVLTVAGVAAMGMAVAAHAQVIVNPSVGETPPSSTIFGGPGLRRPRIINPVSPPIFRVMPNVGVQQAASNIALLGRAYANVPPYAFGYNPYPNFVPSVPAAVPYYSPYSALAANSLYSAGPAGYPAQASLSTNPYSSTGGYDSGAYYSNPYTSYTDPVSGYLRGAADVTNAQARFLESRQRALLTQQQVEQAKIDTRRRIFEEWMYERANTPTMQDNLEKAQAYEVRRSRNGATVTEIMSGKALNDLLTDAAKLQATAMGPQLALDEDTIKHINVTSKAGGNIGLLKNEGQLSWPQALRGAAFEAARKQLDQLAPDAVKQAQFGKVDPGTVQDMAAGVKKLHDELGREVFDLPPSQYIEAVRYLRHLDEALKVLGRADAAAYFTPKFAAKGKTVAELVKNMAAAGLQFAPAVPGDEAYYVALHNALASYDTGLQGQAAAVAAPAPEKP